MKIAVILLCVTLAYAIEEEFDDGSGGPDTCVEQYRECKDAAGFDVLKRLACGKDYLKCRAVPYGQCMKACHEARMTCSSTATSWRGHLKCVTDFVKCGAGCRPGPHDDDIEDELEYEELDDGTDGPTCVEQYRECSKTAGTDVLKRLACGKDYLKCRAVPYGQCVKACHDARKTCTDNAQTWREHLTCVTDFVKCGVKCRPGPHDDNIEEDEELDDGSGGQTCVESYRECKANAQGIKDRFKCGQEYLKCRAVPFGKCVKDCHEARKTCSSAATSWREHVKCVTDFVKCGAGCRPGPHDDDLEDELEDEELDDGSGGPTCVESYKECKANAQGIKDRFKCGQEYLKCRAVPYGKCVKDCHEARKACSNAATSWREHLKCGTDFVKCGVGCRTGPHDDELEDEELDDGSGGPTCVETYRECKKNAQGFKEKFQCGKEYLKCRAVPYGKCVKACHVAKKTCTSAAKGWRQRMKCISGFMKCGVKCRPGSHDDDIEDELME